ncbi:MAG: DinB family protein [Pyrinomonadaceae bacterium]
MSKSPDLSNLIAEVGNIIAATQQTFGDLTAPQLNWKPNAESWGIGQCFEHLTKANDSFFPVLEQTIKGEKPRTFWESLPGWPRLFGWMLIKYLSPESTKKLKAPDLFKPSSSDVDPNIINNFVKQQNRLAVLMKQSAELDLRRTKVTSPALSFVTYSLMDCYTIIVVHEKRHFEQAKRVLSSQNNPQIAQLTQIGKH